MPTSTSSIFACPTASESTFASETEIFPPALWPSFVPRILIFSCCASSAESNDVPAPVSKIKSNGPAPFTRVGRRMSGCAPPARRNFTFALPGESVAVVILPISARPCATTPIRCLPKIVGGQGNAPRRNLRRSGDRPLCKPKSWESRKPEDRRTV